MLVFRSRSFRHSVVSPGARFAFLGLVLLLTAALALAGCSSSGDPDDGDDPEPEPELDDAVLRLVANAPPAGDGGWAFSIWAESDTLAFAGGESGRVFRYDGERWTDPTVLSSTNVHFVWGLSRGDVYAISDAVYHWDSNSWTMLPGSQLGALWSVWGTAANDLFVAGNSQVHHWDGALWDTAELTGAGTIWRLWGSATDDVYAVGNGGALWHYDGTDWSELNSGTTSSLLAVHGFAADDVYVAGPSNGLLHWDGTDWTTLAAGGAALDIQGRAADDFWVSKRDSVLHWDGVGWAAYATTGNLDARHLGVGSHRLFLGGYEVGSLAEGVYRTEFFDTAEQLRDLDGAAADFVVAVGAYSYNLYFDGNDWRGLARATAHFTFVDAYSATAVLAGEGGAVLWYGGSNWTEWSLGAYRPLNDGWVASATDAFVVGDDGYVWRFEPGVGVTAMVSNTDQDLEAVWGASAGDVHAVGDNGTIVHFDGAAWTVQTSPVAEDLHALWGSSASNVYAVGEQGAIVHWDGASWSAVATSSSADLDAIWGSSASDVYAVGEQVVLHWDGAAWTAIDSGYENDFVAIWGSGPRNVFLLSQAGSIYRYSE